MNKIKYILLVSIFTLTMSCGEDDTPQAERFGEFVVEFDNIVGTKQMSLKTAGSTDYNFENNQGQTFNLSTFRYYISKIKLSGPNGEVYEDEMKVDANAANVKGYYLIQESEPSSSEISLNNVPYGEYDKIIFTVGIEEDGVVEGAAGGVLDPAEGAWFWNWNSGYVGFGIEGASSASGDANKGFSIHIGGWKDIAPAAGETQRFFNNVKTITLNLGVNAKVSATQKPQAHIVTDALKVLGDINFQDTYGVHSPLAGKPFAENITTAFAVDHVH